MTRIREIIDSLEERDRSMRGVSLDRWEYQDGGLSVGGRRYRLGASAKAQMLHAMRVPPEYFQHIPRDLQEATVNRLGRERGRAIDGRMLVDGDLVLGFQPERRPFVPGANVLRTVMGRLGDAEVEVGRFQARDDGFELSLLMPRVTAEPRRGDITCGGLVVRHSDWGAYDTTVASFLNRLACANGLEVAVGREGVRIGRKQVESEQFMEALDDGVGRVWRGMGRILEGYARLADHEVPDVQAALLRLVRSARLGRKVEERVLRALLEEPELGRNAYAMVNAITRVTTHDRTLSERERTALERIAAGQAVRGVHRCGECHQVVVG